jgi:MinD superfamily P-loop ATPase
VNIAVASGKGGTGKTSLSVNLALSIPHPVRILDCDVDEPNVHLLVSLTEKEVTPVHRMVPEFDESKCTKSKQCSVFCPSNAILIGKKGIAFFPELCIGCGGCILSCPNQAIRESKHRIGELHRGISKEGVEVVYGVLDVGEAQVIPAIKAVKASANSTDNLTVIVDSPPGVSCPMVESVHGADYCLLVTEPTPFGLHDLRLAVDTIRQLGIPIGVVVNRAGQLLCK